jgi:SAM-dependent methyltransferase
MILVWWRGGPETGGPDSQPALHETGIMGAVTTPDPVDRFRERYAQRRGEVARRIERSVLGHEVGQNGFTTVAQADTLCDVLSPAAGGRLLEVGCGHGWPGFHVAQRLECSLVGSDIPLDALREAQANVGARRLKGHAWFVAADGRALPFPSGYFDAAVHADTFC